MTDQAIIYLLAFLGYAGVVLTQIRRRSTTIPVWFRENAWGLGSGLIAAVTVVLIGPGDNVDLGSYMARTWAAGIASGIAYLVGGNVVTPDGTVRRTTGRAQSKLVEARKHP